MALNGPYGKACSGPDPQGAVRCYALLRCCGTCALECCHDAASCLYCNLAHFSGLQFIKMKINTESMPIILNKNQSTSIIINHTHHNMNPRFLMVSWAGNVPARQLPARPSTKNALPRSSERNETLRGGHQMGVDVTKKWIDFHKGKRNPGWCLLRRNRHFW